MKTAKVTTVHGVKPFNGQNGTTYYCNLTLDNGDEINIGKKKAVVVGDELTYELTGGDEGQQRFKKAKSVNPQFNGGSQSQSAPKQETNWRAKDLAIIHQNALSQANSFYGVVGFDHKDKAACLNQLLDTADIIAKHVISKSGI